MSNFLQRIAAVTMLAGGLLFSNPVHSTEVNKPKVVKPAEKKESLEVRVDKIPEKKVNINKDLVLYFDGGFFYVDPMRVAGKEGSILNRISEKEGKPVLLPTIGISLDYIIKSGRSYEIPIGGFFNFSSTTMFDKPIDKNGTFLAGPFNTNYSFSGDANYFNLGARVSPSAFFDNGKVKIGGFFEFGVGMHYLTTKGNYQAGVKEPKQRANLEDRGLKPDVAGSIDIEGFGGIVRSFFGVVIGAYGATCTIGVGFQWDITRFEITENNSGVTGKKTNISYTIENDGWTPAFTTRCGVRL
jgi:hypothetical protein